MAELLVVNPYKHRRHRRRNPSARRRRVRYHHRAHNPRRRRHWVRGHVTRRGFRVKGHMSNPHRYRHRRRRNPWSAAGDFTDDVLMPGLLGAAGGVALQLAWNAFGCMLPTALSGNQLLTVASQAAAGVGLGWLGGKALGTKKGDAIAVGAVAIVLYNYVASMISTSPTLQGLRGPRVGSRWGNARMGAYMPGQGLRPQMHAKVALGAYMPGQGLQARSVAPRTLGAYAAMNPAPFLRGRPGTAAGRFYGR